MFTAAAQGLHPACAEVGISLTVYSLYCMTHRYRLNTGNAIRFGVVRETFLEERQMAGIVQEFKQFAIKGNVMDLAVGVIIGGAFSTIVTSIVKDLIMPVVGVASGGFDFSNKFLRIGHIPATFKGNPDSYKDLQTAGVAVFGYGSFITVVINFLILAFIVFLIVKGINKLRELETKKSAEPAAEPPTPEDVLLLREIRDELKNQQQQKQPA